MSITDELREWAHGFNGPWRRNEEMLLAIADRIDAKHERTFRNLTDALHKQEDATRELDEKSVLLPVDAGGEVIHIGDVMEWVPYDEDYPSVVREVAAVGVDVFFAWDKANRRYEQCEAHAYRHHHEPTVEDLLQEFVERWHDTHHDDIPALFAEYAAKLRLAGDAE